MWHCGIGRVSGGDVVVPSFANTSAFSFPQMPVWAAIHLSSRVLVVPRWLRALRHSPTVLLLMLSVVMAWIEDRLSVQMMICLLLFDVRWVQASVIAVSSA